MQFVTETRKFVLVQPKPFPLCDREWQGRKPSAHSRRLLTLITVACLSRVASRLFPRRQRAMRSLANAA